MALWKPWLAIVVVAVSLFVVLALALASPLGAYARLEELLGRFGHAVGTAVNWLLMPLLSTSCSSCRSAWCCAPPASSA